MHWQLETYSTNWYSTTTTSRPELEPEKRNRGGGMTWGCEGRVGLCSAGVHAAGYGTVWYETFIQRHKQRLEESNCAKLC